MSERSAGWTEAGALRVPQITAAFWVIKGFSTALGEAMSDWSVHAIAPEVAVVCGFVAFVVALLVQMRRRGYQRWAYWFAVAMVGVFGTMAADVLHVAVGVPYAVSSIFYAVVLAAVFVVWRRVEGTLSIHDVNTGRREAFYWATVVATFATGTAVGDLTAITFHLGYIASTVLFAGLILVPAFGYRVLRWNGVASFWIAYVLTRPLGASVADALGKPRVDGGLGWGDGIVAGGFAVAMILMVAYLARARADVQPSTREADDLSAIGLAFRLPTE